MREPYDWWDRPQTNPADDWLSKLLTYQGGWGPFLWAGEQDPSQTGYSLYNPSSPQSPYRDSGLPGTYRSSEAGQNSWGGAAGTPSSSGAAAGASAWNPAAADAAFANGMGSGVGAIGAGAGGATGAGAGAALDWIDRLAGIGLWAGQTAGQRSGERNIESLANAANYRTQQDAMLRAYQLAMMQQAQLPGVMARANVLASPPQNLSLSHPRATMPTMSGGLQMSDLTSGASKALGEAMQRSALQQGLQGYNPSGLVMSPPSYLQGNALDTFLNAAGAAGGLANAWRNGTGQRRT